MFKKIYGLISVIFIMFVLVSCTNRTVELTFHTNEGTSVETIVIDQGSLVEIPTTSKEGYTFQGWYENSNFDESSKFLFDVPVVRNMTFYAKWSINSYQMVFFPDNDTSIPSREYVYQGDVILPTPTKEGYEFVGWFEGSIDGTRFDLDKMPARNVNLYAKWSIYSYTITFLIDDVVFETKTVTHGGTLTDIPVPPSITGKVRYWDHTDFTNITSDMEVNLIEDDAYYQVVVKDTFGTVYETLTIRHGDPFIPTVTPSKEGYLFVGYNPGINHIITSNLDVMVIYEQITFLVIFRNEQGTPIKEVNIALGEDAVPPTYLAPNGYDFSGWSKSFENVTENLTIDPILTPKTYEVKLNANGGLFEGQQNEFVISAAYLSIIGLPPTPTKEGYQFGGWFDNIEGTGTAYTFSPSTVMPLEGLELFAKWSVRNYSLTYSNLNGTTHSNPTSYTILSNTMTLNAPTNRTGYQFIGWFDTLNGGNQVTEITLGSTGNKILYARFSPITYSITYNNLEGTTHSNPETYNIETPTINLANPTSRTGYNFVGWFTTLSGGNEVTEITLGSTGNKTLYARFTAKTYTITYNLNGGTGPSTLTVTYNQSFTLGVASKTGYEFTGWMYLGNSFASGTWLIDGDVTIDAVFSPITYTITYSNLEGTTHTNPENYTIETTTITLLDPTNRTGYNFIGWFDTLNGGNQVTEITLGSTGNKTLYARFSAKTYTLTYNLYGGTGPSALNVTYNQSFTLGTASKAGYHFTGWTYSGNPFTSGTWIIDSNITIDAVYTPITYTITYNNLEGTTHTNPITYTIETESIILEEPTNRLGYQFVGWFNQMVSGDEVLAISLGSAGNKNLYARFEPIVYDITYSNLQGTTSVNPTTYHIETNTFNLTNPTSRTGYNFVGWFDALSGGNQIESILKGSTGDIELFARFTSISYSITYSNLEGTTSVNPTTYHIETPSINLQNPTEKPGYDFVGWFTNQVGGSEVVTIPEGSTGNRTLYARFEVITYNITYNNLNGTTHSNPLTYTIETATITLTNPTNRIGYNFVGWFDALVDGDEVTEVTLGSTGNVEVFARFTPITYTVTYSNLEGTIHGNPATYTIETTTITLQDPTNRVGYNFVGWFDAPLGGDEVSEIVLGSTGNIEVYARFTAKTHTLTYNLNGGTGPTTLSVTYDQSFTLGTASKVGYQFTGWTYLENPFTSGTWMIDSDVTIDAVYTPITYNITYNNLNGTTHANPLTYTIETATITLLDPTNRTGYNFVGWFDALNGGNEVSEITLGSTGHKTMYARFTAKTYTLTYNLNGGTGPSTLSVTYNESFTLGVATKDEYTFAGWLYQGLPFTSGIWTIDNDITIDAQWTEWPVITFEVFGGSGVSQIFEAPGTVITAPNNPVKNGYIFEYWYESDDSIPYVFDTMPATNLTLYAKYSIETYDVTFENLQGTTHGNPATYTIETATITLQDPTNRLGYNFDGWFDSSLGGTEVTEITLGSTGNLTLYARFSPVTYNITYSNLNGTTHSNPATYTIETATITLTNPTNRTGYNFVGWFDALTDGNEVLTIDLGSTGNVEVFARFEAITYNITYSNLLGTTHSNPATYTIETPNITLLETTYRTGYNFVGWYTALSGGTKVETINLGSTGNLELFARFTAKTYTLTYNLNGGTGASSLTVTYNQAYTLGTVMKVGYSFAGWVYEGSPFTSGTWLIDSNISIDATYTAINYNLVYNDLEGTTHTNPSSYTIETPTFELLAPTSRLGYDFVGWFNQSSGGTLVTEIPSGSTGTIVLYARFSPVTYNITYSNLNGTTHSNPATYTIESTTFYLNAPTERAAYQFVGWFDALEGGTQVTEITLGTTGHKAVYARFSPVTYTISYNNLNGTTHYNPATYTIETTTITLQDPTYRIGYDFVGWFDAVTDGNKVETITVGSTGNKTLYARFTAKTYTVTYNLNGGTGPSTLNVTYNQTFTLGTASKVGYQFTGWTYSGNPFTSGTWSIDGDITIDAVYSPITYTITYNNLEGTTHSNPDTYTIETSTITLFDPTYRTGYNFVGWFDALNGGNEVTAITLGSTGDLELFARFTAKSYTVTYNLNGGTGPTTLNVTYNESFTLGVASKTGYEFTGWTYLGDAFVSGTWSIDSNITIEATYEAVIYEIDYQNLLGTTHSNPENYTIETATITLLDPTNKAGYNFVGWFDASTEGTEVTEITIASFGDLTLYARFEAITYTVTYLNLFDMIHDNDLTITTESEFILTDPSIRTGYRFLGWFTELESGIRVLEVNAGNLSDITLYARWEIAYYDVAGTYVFERLDISENQTEILETVTNEGSQSFFIPSLLHGTEILPVTEIEGYMFNRLVYNGVTYDDIEHLITVVDHIDLENLAIYYRRLILEVVFIQNDEASVPGTSPITYKTSIRYTHYNLGIDTSNIPVLYTYANITSLWERSTISQVQSTMTVSALYFNTTTKTIRFKDGSSIIFIASELGLTPQTEFITTDALIWDLTKPGFRFLGWFYMNGETEIELTPGSYAFEDFTANQTEIYTKWQQLISFNQVTDVLVTINESDDITISWELDLNGLTNPSFDIYVDQEKVVGYQSMIQKTGNVFTLSIPALSVDYGLFDKLIEVGMHRVTVQAIGDNVNHMTGLMSEPYVFEVKSIYDENPSDVDTYDYFIVEDYQGTLRYIFYTNMTYQFNSGYQFEIITGSDLVTLNNPYTMKMNQISGQFRFKITRPDESFNIYDGLVVKDIKGFSFGTNYQQYLDETGVQSSYVDQSDPYIVGTKNSFYLDLRMTSSTGNRIRLDDALLSYEFYLYNGSTYNLIAANDLSNHVDLLPNNRLQFKTGTEGNMYQVKVSPKYQSTRMTVSELTFEFVVNAGYNAFTHQDLKEFFSDDSVDLINLHANIQPVLSPNQLNSDGSPKNVKNGLGNVYNRNLTSTNNNEVRIEGNFMVINGSNLPYSNARSGSGLVGFAEAFEIVNVQIAIFNYNVTGTEPDTNKFTMNNLTIIGNTTVPSVNFGGTSEEILLQERLMSRNSGGYIGVMVNNGSSEFNNIQIRFAVIGISHYAYGEDVEMIVDQSIIKDSWANSMYMQGATKLTVTNSIYGQSGGSAFHLSDSRAGGGINNPTLIINDTEIENFISGEEAWFKAYGMTSVALQLKSGISQGIASTGRTIIETVTHPVTGVQTEMINFILLTEPHTGAEVKDVNSNIIGGSEVSVTIDGKTTNRPYNYLSSSSPTVDPRITDAPVRQFAYPMSLYSDAGDFMNLIYYLMSKGIPQQGASNLAFLGGFYNLTANELLAYATNQQTVEQISSPRAIPNYLEVLAPIPVFPTGYAVVIIELQ